MKSIGFTVFVLLLFCSRQGRAQFNLVPNPSFETYNWCPSGIGNLNAVSDWDSPVNLTTPDYFNSCAIGTWVFVPQNRLGYQFAHAGQAYAGIVTSQNAGNPQVNSYREYIQCQLTQPLIGGGNYFFRAYVSGGDSSQYTSNDFGVYFSNSHIQYSCPTVIPCNLPFTPQIENPSSNSLFDRINWVEINGNYIASGGEEYLIIGNFKDSVNTVAQPTGWSNPNSGYFYSYFYIDDILLTPVDSLTSLSENSTHGIKIFPTICTDKLTIEFTNTPPQDIIISDLLGRRQGIVVVYSDENSIELSTSEFKPGVYVVSFVVGGERGFYKIVKD